MVRFVIVVPWTPDLPPLSKLSWRLTALHALPRLFLLHPLLLFLLHQTLYKTKTVPRAFNALWNQAFEFDEIGGGEYLKVTCYNEDLFGDDHIGSARVNLQGLVEGSVRDVWVPLEKVSTGELRLQIEAQKKDEAEGSRVRRQHIPCALFYSCQMPLLLRQFSFSSGFWRKIVTFCFFFMAARVFEQENREWVD